MRLICRNGSLTENRKYPYFIKHLIWLCTPSAAAARSRRP